MASGVTLKSLVKAVLAATLMVGAGSAFSVDQPVLKVSTVPLPPLITVDPQTGLVSGPAAESVRRMARSCRIEVEFVAPPGWSRAFTMGREGTTDALIPTNHSKDRTKFFDFHPHALLDLGPALMVRAESNIMRYSGLDQLRGQRIAIQKSILIEPAFDTFIRSGQVKLTIRGNATALVEELLTGRVDYIADSKAVLEHYLGESGILKRVRTLEPAFGSAPQYLAFSKKRSAAFASGTPLFECLMASKP